MGKERGLKRGYEKVNTGVECWENLQTMRERRGERTEFHKGARHRASVVGECAKQTHTVIEHTPKTKNKNKNTQPKSKTSKQCHCALTPRVPSDNPCAGGAQEKGQAQHRQEPGRRETVKIQTLQKKGK